jgi:predicted nucleic acid-binding protein
VYLDSNTLIAHINGEPGHEVLNEVLRLADIGASMTVQTSALSLVEVRGWTRADGYSAEKDEQARSYLDHPRFMLVEFGRAVALRARTYSHRYNLSNYDAIHLASAVHGGAETLMTFDKGFPLGQSVDGVWVDRPYQPGDDIIPGT